MNGGYIMVDCTGLNLNKSTSQTVTGLYARAEEALATGKPVYVVNTNMSGAPCSPVSVIAWHETNKIIATGHVLRVQINANDTITVTNLVAS